MSEKNNHAYWQANLRLMLVLLVIWFSVSFLAGIIFVDFLNQFRLYGYKLGFWFSQQGAIYFFVLLIFVYAWRMNVLDKKFGVAEE
jgi:putative solute:sodium symporter small subunit